MKRSILMVLLLFLTLVYAQAQTRVTGRVTDKTEGSPLSFVTVSVKGTTIGAHTDNQGAYSINVPNNEAVLVFSFIGYKNQEQVVGSKSVINVALETEASKLDEVVVVALGMKADKKALGYASQDVKGKELVQAGNPNLMTALQGRVAGVEIKPSSGMPGASSQVVIRGARSFTGNNTPLYVVDGMPIASTADFTTGSSSGALGDGVTGTDIANRALDIDPNDIESINVLRGQAAAALYGIRASNGVIVITTKSGKNQVKGKPIVSFSMNSSLETLSRRPKFQQTWAQGSGGAFSPTASMSWGPKVEDLPNDPNYGGNMENKWNNGNPSNTQGRYYVPQLEQAGLDPWARPQRYDNINDFFQTGYTVNTSVNVSQATEYGNYSLGFGNATQEGVIPSTASKRTSFKAAAETKLNQQWKTGFTANYIQNSIDKAPGGNDALLGTVYPAPVNYDLKGIPSSYPTNPFKQINYRSLTFNNPYWAIDHNKFTEKTNRFFGNTYLEFTPEINWSEDKKLSLKYQLGTDSYTTNYQDIFEYGSRGSRGMINNYGITATTYNSLFVANYEMDINEDFKLTAILGNEFDQLNTKRYEQNGQNFNFGGWPNIGNATIISAGEKQRQKRTVGFFGSASLAYRNMAFLNITGRRDVISSMPRGNRGFFYPSVSSSFIFTELDQLKNDIVTFGKIRASYAEVGQAADYYNDFYYTPSYGSSWWSGEPISYPIDGINAFVPFYEIYDPNLRPQNTKSYEFGVELRFLNGLIGLDYTFSRQNVRDQIFPVPLAGSSGASYKIQNGGKIHTNSHEIILTVNPISNNEWNWSVGLNFSTIRNYVDELAPGVESIFLGGYDIPQVRAGKGTTFPVIYGQGFSKDKKGRILVDEDPTSDYYGMPLGGAPTVIAKVSPDFNMGFNTNLQYKKWFLAATFDWKQGGQMYSGTNGLSYLYGTSLETEDRTTPFVYNGYKADGTPNNIQRGGKDDPDAYQYLYSDLLGNIDEAYIFNSSFLKMRELTVGYKFPKMKGIDLNVSFFMRNILIWTKLPNLDPESSQGNTNMGGAFERFSMPQTSSYGIGINLVF